jgi:predicted Fe-Mo cluster-binding NifX family protein
MKIAVVTEDGVKISAHFGRAPYYVVVTIEDGQIVGREQREKVAHGQGHSHGLAGQVHLEGEAHGFDAAAQDTHSRMAAPIADCQVLLARGMGMGAYEGLKQAGIQPILTDIATIDEAIAAYLAGVLVDHPERLH